MPMRGYRILCKLCKLQSNPIQDIGAVRKLHEPMKLQLWEELVPESISGYDKDDLPSAD